MAAVGTGGGGSWLTGGGSWGTGGGDFAVGPFAPGIRGSEAALLAAQAKRRALLADAAADSAAEVKAGILAAKRFASRGTVDASRGTVDDSKTPTSKKYPLLWKTNPPIIRNAAGEGRAAGSKSTENSIYHNGGDSTILSRKGLLYPNTSLLGGYASDGGAGPTPTAYTPGDGSILKVNKSYTPGDGSILKVTEATTSTLPDLINNQQPLSMFRFMYNPASISVNQSTANSGLNIQFLTTAAGSSVTNTVWSPASLTGGTMKTISCNFIISRVEDMQIIVPKYNSEQRQTRDSLNANVYDAFNAREAGHTKTTNPKFTTEYTTGNLDPSYFYGDPNNYPFQITQHDLEMIYTRGTMYDIEYIYRVALGTAYNTNLRGYTADLGYFYSTPLILSLGPGMIYPVLLSGLDYTHQIFTKEMVPIYTEVSMSFGVLPDAQSTKKAPFDA